MILNAKYSDTSRYSGKVLLSAIILGYISIALVIFMRYVPNIIAVSGHTCSLLAAQSASKTIKAKTKLGVVTGITYNPSSSCALINETIVHPGDTIHKVTVVGIQNDVVVFAKDGLTWQQKVLDPPHPAWPKNVN
jgi:hypothetical protein